MTRTKARIPLVAIVDGDGDRRLQVARALMYLYRVGTYKTTGEALREIAKERPDVILVDEAAPPAGGRRLIEILREWPATADTAIIYSVNPEHLFSDQGFETVRANTVLVRPYGCSAVVAAVTALINTGVEQSWQALPPLQRQALQGTSQVFTGLSEFFENGRPPAFGEISASCQPLVEAVRNDDFKGILDGVRGYDNYSYAHSIRVATLLSLLAQGAGFSAADQLMLASGGLLHDAGKMSIPHEVLNKPGRLNAAERTIMEGHVAATMRLLRASERIPNGVMIIAEQHHEKIDGTGYPNRLKGDDLNELARMAAIVDIFCALTDRRVYKPAMPAEPALKIMTHDMASHIDQHILKLFRHILLYLVMGS